MIRGDLIVGGVVLTVVAIAAGTEIEKRTHKQPHHVIEYMADSLLIATIEAERDTIDAMRRALASCVGVLYNEPPPSSGSRKVPE